MNQKISSAQRTWDALQFFLCLGILGLLLAYLVWLTMGGTLSAGYDGQTQATLSEPVVQDVYASSAMSVTIRSGSPILIDWILLPLTEQRRLNQ
jgi:hypothetical protein